MNDRDEGQERANLAQKVTLARRAISEGRFKVRPEDVNHVKELMAAHVGPLGLVDPSGLSNEALGFARVVGLAVRYLEQGEPARQENDCSIQEGQSELFRHFTHLFVALI